MKIRLECDQCGKQGVRVKSPPIMMIAIYVLIVQKEWRCSFSNKITPH